ncbi:MAG: hypothetical protein ACRD1T_21305, partial [Acidimicrobiia bacterium]
MRGQRALGVVTLLVVAAALVPVVVQAVEVSLIFGQETSWGTRRAGETVDVVGRGFPSGQKGEIRFGSTEGPKIGNYTASTQGTFQTQVTLPSDAQSGPATVVACVPLRVRCDEKATA